MDAFFERAKDRSIELEATGMEEGLGKAARFLEFLCPKT